MTCRMNRIIIDMPKSKTVINTSEYMKWRNHVQLKFDVMPKEFWRNPLKMYENDHEWHNFIKEKTDV